MNKNIDLNELYIILKSYQISGVDVFFNSFANNFYSMSAKSCFDVNSVNLKSCANNKDLQGNTSINILKQKNTQQNLYATNSAIKEAEDIANSSDNLDTLKYKVQNSNFCQLKKYALNTVFGYGFDKNPDVMIIGEAPGADEDKQGLPFVGVSGQLLDKIFNMIDISREKNAYISNILKWRPPGNRTPTPEECFICMPILKKQIELVNPKMIVLVGGVASHALLNNSEGITKIRGCVYDYECCGRVIKTIPMFHPSYLLRNPISKKLAYIDILKIQEVLQSI